MANDFAIATRTVLIGMAVALAIAFLVALLHPGDRVTEARVEYPQPDGDAPVAV